MIEQTENPRAGRRDAAAVLEKIVHGLEEKVQLLMNEQGELYETVSVLESSICLCGDCVMHRDKARHSAASTKGACMTHVPSEEPATRRKHPGLDSCHLHRRTLLESDIPNHWFCPACHPGLVAPAVPVREAGTGAAVCATCGGERRIPRASPTPIGAWKMCPACSPKAPVQDDHNTAGLADICRTAALVQDVRERSLDDVEAKWADGRIDQRGALRAAYDAGLLAGPPQTVTRDKLIALMGDFDRAPDGTHYGDLIDKHFPGLDVVEG